MGTLLLFLAAIVAILWIFARVFRGRVAARLQDRELPPELAALQARAPARVAAATGAVAATAATRPSVPAASPHFLLIYDVAPDYVQRRAQFRDEHLGLAWKAAEAGELVLGGALEEPVEHAFLLFRGSREAALRFAAADPYVKNGLVKAFKVKQWHTVVGANAATPVRPKA